MSKQIPGFLLGLFTFCWFVFPGHARADGLSLAQVQALKHQLNSEPVKAGAELDRYLLSHTPEEDPVIWIKVFTLHLLLFRDDFEGPESKILQKKLLPKAEAVAANLPESRTKLEFDSQLVFARILYQLREKTMPDFNMLFQELIARAEKMGDNGLASLIFAEYAAAKNRNNEGEEAFRLAGQALDKLRLAPDEDPLDQASVKANVAFIYVDQERYPDSLQLYIDIQNSVCQGVQNAYFCNAILMNIANIYLNPIYDKEYYKAEIYLDQAIKAARSIHDEWVIGVSEYLRSRILFKQKKYEEALEANRVSLSKLERRGDEEYIFLNLVSQAKIEYKLRNFQVSLAALQKAEKFMPANNIEKRTNVDLIYVDVYEGLEQYKKAFTIQQKLYYSLKKEMGIKADANYNSAVAQVGLLLEKEKNRVLAKDQEITQLKLQETEKVQRFLLFSLVLLLLLVLVCIWAILRSREVKRIKNSLQHVLDTIEEAILMIDSELKVKGPTSRFLQRLRPNSQNPVGQDFVDSVLSESQLSGDQCSTIREVLKASMGEEMLAWELNAGLLPMEIAYTYAEGLRLFAINWQPLLDRAGVITSIMVSLHDITERRALEAAIESERQERGLASNCLLELSTADINRSRQVIEEARDMMKNIASDPVTDSTLRDIHTLKGTSRSLKLKGLSGACHDFEDSVKNGQANAKPLMELLDVYNSIIEQIQPEKMGLSTQEPVDLLSLWQRLQPALQGRLLEEKLQLTGFAIFDRVNNWPKEYMKDLENCLLHAINNSIDHGFVRPREDGRSASIPYFELEGLLRDDHLIVNFRDNGIGLDLSKLEAIAAKKGFVPGPGETLADIVFYDGVSTASAVTETSGRGVGMAAIRAICRDRQGDVNIAPSSFSSGTELRLKLPLPRATATVG